jgi:hypothetical protein
VRVAHPLLPLKVVGALSYLRTDPLLRPQKATDAAATDLYAGYAWYDGKIRGALLDAGRVVIVGARIKF